jgi:hypothetical protein
MEQFRACGTARSQEVAVSIPEANVTIIPEPVRAAYLSIAGITEKLEVCSFLLLMVRKFNLA